MTKGVQLESVENVLTLQILNRPVVVSPPPLHSPPPSHFYFVFEVSNLLTYIQKYSRNELACLAMGNIFLVYLCIKISLYMQISTFRLSENKKVYQQVNIQKWIENNKQFKYIGDIVDVSVDVRDIRSDHQKHLLHMFNLLVIKSIIPSNLSLPSVATRQVMEVPLKIKIFHFLSYLSILVSRIYVKGLNNKQLKLIRFLW